MLHVSAWVPFSDTLTPAKTVAELERAGISTAVLMINDFSEERGPTPFKTFDRDKLIEMASACRAAEREVQLCSWVMPHDVFVDGAIAELPSLIEDTGADLLMWDAEEPWTQAKKPDYLSAVRRLAAVFDPFDTGLTAIGSAPVEVTLLAQACSVWVPQCYATTDSRATPGKVVAASLNWWRERYGSPARYWSIGLAAYDQADDVTATMLPPIDDAREAEIWSVCYWTSNAIASRRQVTEFVSGLSSPLPLHPGVFQPVDLASRSSEPEAIVRQIQALLAATGRDPGKLDGLRGPKTRRALEALQRARGLPATGVVDGPTWLELLRP